MDCHETTEYLVMRDRDISAFVIFTPLDSLKETLGKFPAVATKANMWSFPNPNPVVCVPQPYYIVSTALSQHKTGGWTQNTAK